MNVKAAFIKQNTAALLKALLVQDSDDIKRDNKKKVTYDGW